MSLDITYPESHLETIRSYYREFCQIAEEEKEKGYVSLNIVALIIDMLYLFGKPTYQDLVYIFGSKEQADTIARIYEIIKPTTQPELKIEGNHGKPNA